MIFRRWILLAICCVPLLGFVSGCGSAPPNEAPTQMTQEEIDAYNKKTAEEEKKLRQGG